MKDKLPKIKIGFTVGDMNGVGPEVLLQALSEPKILELFTPVIYGPLQNLAYTAEHFGLESLFNSINDADTAADNKLNLIDDYNCVPKISFDKLDKKMGEVAFLSIEKGVEDLKKNKIHALVTAPINKEAIHSDKFNFMGHTDYIDSQIEGNAIMMMVSESLKVALLTEHIPISKVSNQITKELVCKKIIGLNETLKKDFLIDCPKIALLAIDPHAGDNGVIGCDDKNILIPALKTLNASGILVSGPYAADSFFGSSEFKKFDLVVASYHDQGLIPFKTLSFGMGVNYTSGLNRIRTSPDHGTAYGIAGKGVALKDSFLSSIFLAIDLYKSRNTFSELQKQNLFKEPAFKSNDK